MKKRDWIPNPTGKGSARNAEQNLIVRRFVDLLFKEFGKSGNSLSGFARGLGLDPAFLCMWFNGKRGGARLETVVMIWKKLGRSLDEDFLK